MASSTQIVNMILDVVPSAFSTSFMNVTPSVTRFLNQWSFNQPPISSWNPYALCFRPYRSLMHRSALPLCSLYRPCRIIYTGSLHFAMRNAHLISNWYRVRFFRAAIAHIVRIILNLHVGANFSIYDPGFCCLPSVFARARHSGSFLAEIFPEPRPGFEWVTGTKLTKSVEWHIFVTKRHIPCSMGRCQVSTKLFFSSSNKCYVFPGTWYKCEDLDTSSNLFAGFFGLEQRWVRNQTQVLGSRCSSTS